MQTGESREAEQGAGRPPSFFACHPSYLRIAEYPVLVLKRGSGYNSEMFAKRSDTGYHPAMDGIERKTLVHGDQTLMTEFVLRKGAVLPRHSHPHEQTGYLLRGSLRLSIGTHQYYAQAGDSWCIAGGVEHGATALENSVAIEVFSPVREDYLPS